MLFRSPQSFRTAIDSFHILSVHLPYFLRTKGRITVRKNSKLLTPSVFLPPFCPPLFRTLSIPFPPFFHIQALPHVLFFHTFSIRLPFFFHTFASLFFTQITQHRPGIQLRFLHSYQRGKTAPTVAGSATIYPLPVSWYPLKIASDRFFAKTPNFQRDMDVSSTEKRAPRKA